MLVGITIIAFTFINLAPGDPVSAMIDPAAGAGFDAQAMRHRLGLDQPLPLRYLNWVAEVVHGNFGYSYGTGQPVIRRIGERIPATIELTGIALIISTAVGCTLGVLSALRRYSIWDYVLTILSIIWISVPAFFFALIGLYVLSLKLQWLPTFGMVTPDSTDPLDPLKHLILPVAVLSLEALAGNMRYTRSAMLEVLRQDYMTTARAKGLSARAVTLAPWLPQCAAASHHGRLAAHSGPAGRRGRHRISLPVAGHGHPGDPVDPAARLPGADGPDADDLDAGTVQQSAWPTSCTPTPTRGSATAERMAVATRSRFQRASAAPVTAAPRKQANTAWRRFRARPASRSSHSWSCCCWCCSPPSDRLRPRPERRRPGLRQTAAQRRASAGHRFRRPRRLVAPHLSAAACR